MAITQRDTARAEQVLVDGLGRHLLPLAGGAPDYDPLLQAIGPARFALLGEASHGTHEFYGERIRITQRLSPSAASPPWPSKRTGPMPGA